MITVGIVTYNSVPDLPTCFDALQQQTAAAQMQIMVHDNCSSDDTVRWLQTHAPHARLLLAERNLGYGQGHNRIIQACGLTDDDYYLTLNPDARLAPDYVARLVDTIERTGAGWAVGKLLASNAASLRLYSAGHALLRGGFAFHIGYGMPDDGRFDTEREIFGAPGAAALISGRMIRALASDGVLFEPAFFLYYEDVDLDWSARRQGWRCWYQPAAQALHHGSNPPGGLRDEALCNRYLTAVKNAYLPDLLTYNLPLIALHLGSRLLLSPRRGGRLMRLFASRVGAVWRRRTPPTLSRAEMNAWFRWSQHQYTRQPIRLSARLWNFLSHG